MFIKTIESNYNLLINTPYWYTIPAVQHLTKIKLTKPVTIFVGENGSGKSTLIEAIAINYGMNPEGGGRNFNFATNESHSNLHDYIRVGKLNHPQDSYFLRAESFYNLATQIDALGVQHSYGEKSLHHQSHGESFISLLMNRFRGNSLYILDEPESALSPMRQMTMLARIHELVKEGAQFIIATHSPILMAYPNAEIIQLDENGMQRADYKQTDHFTIMKAFMENPEKMISILLED